VGTRGTFPSGKVAGACSYTSTPQYAFMAWCSVEARGQLYLSLQYKTTN